MTDFWSRLNAFWSPKQYLFSIPFFGFADFKNHIKSDKKACFHGEQAIICFSLQSGLIDSANLEKKKSLHDL